MAYSYIHPSFVLQFLHITSRTIWRPVNMTRSWMCVYVRLTTRLKSNARPKTTTQLLDSFKIAWILLIFRYLWIFISSNAEKKLFLRNILWNDTYFLCNGQFCHFLCAQFSYDVITIIFTSLFSKQQCSHNGNTIQTELSFNKNKIRRKLTKMNFNKTKITIFE